MCNAYQHMETPMSLSTRLQSHPWDCALDPEISPAFLALQWAQRQSLDGMLPLLRQFGLSHAEFDVLATLRNASPPHELTPSQIQAEVVITSGGLTKVMAQLETRGLVERSQHAADLRVKPVRLSEQGQQCVERAMEQMMANTGRWLRAALTREEIAQLTHLLSKLLPSD